MGSMDLDGGDGPIASINVTPLVDVMLVLLVIFMVTAPMLQQGVEVNLPKATSAPLEGKGEQLVISIDKEGRVYLGSKNEIPVEEIGKKIAAVIEAQKSSQSKVYIKGDTELQYGVVMQVMARLYESGVTQIGLVSDAPETGKR